MACEYVVYICYALQWPESGSILKREALGSDFEVNGALATNHPSHDVPSQAFPDFKNAHNYAQWGKPGNQG